jgi:uncharacterized protein (TIGR03086 family)
MTEISERYRRNSERVLDLIRAVPDGGWDAPSPCEGWRARDVVQHVVDTQGMFLRLVGREQIDLPPCTEDPLGAATAAFGQIQADLDDPDAASATFEGQAFGTQTFAAAVDRFLSFDLVVHGWDLARATGQDEAIPGEELDLMERAAEEFGDSGAMRGPGGFGPEVEAPPGADRQQRILAYLGRVA